MAIDRLPSGRFRARLMIDGQRYTATLPTEADARVWEIEARGAAIRRRGAASVTFAAYATGWLAGFVETRRTVRGSRQRSSTGFPVLGELPLFEVLEADRDELERRVVDGDEGAARECLQLILGDAAEDLRVGALAAVVQVGQVPARRDRLREYTHERYSSRNRTGRRSLCRICVTAWRPMLPRSGWDGRRTKCGRWFVPISEVRRLQRLRQPVGRPFSPGSAWALLAMLAGDDPEGLSAPRRSQLRRHLRDVDSNELAARLGRRASRRLVYAHPSMLDALAADPRVVLTGLAAAEHAGARLVGADNGELEGYVAESDLAGLYASYGLVDAETVANVVLHVADDEAQVPRQSGMAAAPVVGLDLWESGDARASDEGQRLFTEALETFRER